MKILIIGGSGLIGYNLFQNLKNYYDKIECTYLKNKILDERFHHLDTTNYDTTVEFIKKSNPDVVIHTAALAGVDLAEKNHELADSVTVNGTKNVIEGCKITHSKIIYVSTTYVYGNKKKIFTENDEPNPTSYYGKTKYKAEKLIKNSGLPHLILRTDQPYYWIEKWHKNNSVTRAIKTLTRKEILKEVKDWSNVPTYVPDFINATRVLLENSEVGIFNVTGSDYIDRYDWALKTAEIFDLEKKLIKPISSKELDLPVKRDNANVSNKKILKKNGICMKGVKEGLSDMLKSYRSNF
jgi:dTDP-4-dehydrorhamnose reductase|tara:strand:- start:3811 stop:4698 length:888 start_codon:yes stop_codon:yes gene_type:complete